MKKTRYFVPVIVVLLLIGVLLLTQFLKDPQSVTGKIVSDVNKNTDSDFEEFAANSTNELQNTQNTDVQEVTLPLETKQVKEPEKVVESDVCDETNCKAPGICYQGQCKVPECNTDADCIDEDGCTPDVCSFAGHPNAFCSTQITSRPIDGDECCPVSANTKLDIDCAPVCGNHQCEFGESTRLCEVDCKNAGSARSDSTPPADDGGEEGECNDCNVY